MAKKQSAAVNDGIEVLKSLLPKLPTAPGVYRMLNEAGDVLYVGKARNIKARVTQYTQPTRLPVRIRKMVFETRSLVTVQTHTEAEALLLEANLIKSLKPKYNITLRDDSSYVSVVITGDATPLIRSHRGPKRSPRFRGDDGPKHDAYFGPYPSAASVYQTLDFMERIFRLRTCSASTWVTRIVSTSAPPRSRPRGRSLRHSGGQERVARRTSSSARAARDATIPIQAPRL